jgi:hypothetical protein
MGSLLNRGLELARVPGRSDPRQTLVEGMALGIGTGAEKRGEPQHAIMRAAAAATADGDGRRVSAAVVEAGQGSDEVLADL